MLLELVLVEDVLEEVVDVLLLDVLVELVWSLVLNYCATLALCLVLRARVLVAGCCLRVAAPPCPCGPPAAFCTSPAH